MATIGSLLVNLGMNTAEFTSAIKKSNKRLNKFSRKAKKSIKKISKAFDGVGKGVAVMGVAVSAASVKLIDMGSDAEETGSKFATVFAGLENRAQSFSDELVDSFGVSRTESMGFLSSIQDLLVPMGIASDKAADLSFETVKLASDLGSFNNLPTDKVLADMQSALVGNFETMKKYGVVLNETVLKQKALELGIGDSTGKVTAGEKAMIALQIITESSSAAVGDFQRTSTGFANTLKIVKANIADAAAQLGKDFLPQAKAVLLVVKDSIPELLELGTIIGTGLVASVKTAIPIISALTAGFSDLLRAVGIDLRGEVGKLTDEIEKQEKRQGELLQSLVNLSPASALYEARLSALNNVSNKLTAAQGELATATSTVKKTMEADIKFKAIDEVKKMSGALDKTTGDFKDFEKTGVSSFEALDDESQKFATSLEGNLQPIIQDMMTGGIKDTEDLADAISGILVTALATATAGWVATGIAAAAAGATFATALWPITAIILAVGALVLAADALKEGFKAAFGDTIDKLKVLWEKFTELFGGMEGMKVLAGVVLSPLIIAIKAVGLGLNIIIEAFTIIVDFVQVIRDGVGALFSFLYDSLESIFGFDIGGGKGTIEKAVGFDFPFFAFANGGIGSGFNPGIVSSPTLNASGNSVAGEAGAEAIIPLEGGAVPVEMSGGGGGETFVIQFNVDGRTMQTEQFRSSELRRMKLDEGVTINRGKI